MEGGSPVGLGRDHRGGTAIVKLRPEPVRVERFVAEQGAEGDALDEGPHADNVVVLAGQQDEAHQGAEGVDKGDDLGRQATARAVDGLVPGPPFAPLAFGWADSKTRAKTPPFTQRRKRWKTLFQLPKSLGRSRQGTPVRTATAPPQQPVDEVVAPRSTHYIMWLFAALGATYCG